ncbi:hypothetical protein LTR78_008379 [Recurvomyces mirabilis]|uniref:Integral membrane protein n=1 Tax=Recurvomyces mirabilis TaxID=574656 RepID=A0AAE0TQI3_9PEZI|nr:hypothetical protein LTR78_008379 [Recurvomyces mirabilis]KAK5155366.1 hypothetical protein LTS14_005627 [Recurvomyces mirabilis]
MGDYFVQQRRPNSAVNSDRLNVPPPSPGGRSMRTASSRDSLRPPSSIRIRRLPSHLSQQQPRPGSQASDEGVDVADQAFAGGRRRSSSAPQRYQQHLQPPSNELARQRTADLPPHMRTINEGSALPQETPYHEAVETPGAFTPFGLNTPMEQPPTPGATTAMHSAGNAAQRNRGLRRFRSGTVGNRSDDHNAPDVYDSDVVDFLDLIDPEVRAIGTLTNIQNSLFVPDLGGLINRRPTYTLTPRKTDLEGGRPRSRAGTRATARPPNARLPTIGQEDSQAGIELSSPKRERKTSISSQLSDSHYAVLPHGVDLEGWTQEDVDELNDHVRHLMHSRREGFKRSMRGFRQYVSRPLGLFVTTYATLVTLFGAAWVFCLIGWIYVGSKQDYFINIIDNVLVAFFALMGDGLAPFRAVDTYHMCFIAHYHHLTWRLRKEKNLPSLVDHNDLPDRRVNGNAEDIIDKEETAEFSVLSPRQQRRLAYHQAKFSKAHTFYKPHETATHHAFPLRLLITVVVLLDCHSLFQIALGSCTWSIDYHVRSEALTSSILACSLTSNIVAGIIISIGDHRTRKKDVLERIKRQELTEEAIGHVQQKRNTFEAGRSMDVDRATGQASGVDAGPGSKTTTDSTANSQPPAKGAEFAKYDWHKDNGDTAVRSFA